MTIHRSLSIRVPLLERGNRGGLRFFALCLVYACMMLNIQAAPIGTWNCFPAFNNITEIQPVGDIVYVLSSKNLYSYNVNDESIQTYHKINALSDCGISHIAYCKAAKRLVITYDNFNIDLLDDNGSVTNISSYYSKSITDKTINSIYIDGAYAYLSTIFGIIKIDVKKGEISDTYQFGKDVLSSTVYQGYIYAATSTGVYYAPTNVNLLDRNNWQKESDMEFNTIIRVGNDLMAFNQGNLYNQIKPGEWNRRATVFSHYYYYNDQRLVIGVEHYIYRMTGQADVELIDLKDEHTYIAYDEKNNCFWGNQSDGKLFSFTLENQEVVPQKVSINPDGPKSNYFGNMKIIDHTLYSVPGGYDFTMERSRTGMIQTLKGDEWTIYGDDVAEKTGHEFIDMTFCAVDPRDHTHIIAGGRSGLYEFKNGVFVREYNIDNSPLGTALTADHNKASKMNYTLVLGGIYDSNGNLWVVNSQSKTGALFQLNTDNDWNKFDSDELMPGGSSLAYMKNVMIDSRGLLWFVNNFSNNSGSFCVDTRQNNVTVYDDFTNQDGTSNHIDHMRFVSEDKDGNMWIGTNVGPFFMKSDDVNKGDVRVLQQIKVPRNDGTNFADYLLSGVDVTCIAIDGANRKWIGTTGNGIYLISTDNYEQIHHFMAADSYLLSDYIEAIAIDDQSGEVFIATDKGLCSYISDATAASDNMSSDDVYAYPNPVTPDYTGPITVVGLSFDADVKITTTNGVLVAQGRSNGGSFTWDGTDLKGHRVASGVYMVHTATHDGKKGTVCKIAIVN